MKNPSKSQTETMTGEECLEEFRGVIVSEFYGDIFLMTTGLPRFPADVLRMGGSDGDPSANNHPKGELMVKVRQ